GLLVSLQPRVHVHFVARDEVLATLGVPPSNERPSLPPEVGSPEVVVAVVDALHNTNLGWTRRLVANSRLPLIVVATGDAEQRSSLRERAREVGAIDCLLRSELSAPVLEAAIAHARNHGHQIA